MTGPGTERSPRQRTLALGLSLAALLVLSMMLVARPAHAVTLTVTNTSDPGNGTCDAACTLREAITASNSTPDTNDTINFNIPDDPGVPGFEVKTISPTSELPPITDTVTIDGYTQAGAVANSAATNANNAVLKIELNGANAGVDSGGLTLDAGITTIKGLVINRFDDDGLFIGAANTTIEGNFIGTNAAGDADLGNGLNGIRVLSSDNLIGGPANAAQNIISGNGDNGVFVDGESTTASGNVISNNHIGTDADAGEDLGNSDNGVHVFFAPGVLVGGDSADGTLNIISGNDQHGVLIDNIGASGTRVLGNLIGVNLNGNGFSNIGNTRDGVRVSSAPQVEVGGGQPGDGNTISDNGQHGVEIAGTSSTFNKVLGNRIGTNSNGSSAFGNTLDGVRIGNASNATVGGTGTGTGNVISSNDKNGVFISGTSSATNNKVLGNFIGTDATGISDLGNAEVGVRVETPGNFIGGTATGAGNAISGNGGVGVSMLGSGASGNTVQGNFIGTDANGTGALGNFHGVFISDSPDNLVGGTVAAAANTISGNDNHGVIVIGATATGNSILRNSIFGNGTPNGLGIELNNDGVTLNDRKDPDLGPNKLQNFPVLTSASPTTITGKLNSRPRKTFTIQFFSNPAPNFPTGFGEGETFVRQKTVKTNRKGKATFTIDAAFVAGQIVTATATDSAGNTSEFSQGRTVG